ncbi:DUF1552 domain-containing protein [Marinagarivorans algicola]|uniref:DUF1552 domain-containing protein n=1 Tax=Marinagarivorans algicola TaxID=1513270 RepID=UPI0006B55A87|nr:DUF1552 domain-containing protein [Marinagarivorans algicola]
MKNSFKNLKRRSFLASSAASVASISMANLFCNQALAQNSGIKRFIVWYVPEGCAQQAFWPKNTGNLEINPMASFNNNSLAPTNGAKKGRDPGENNPSNRANGRMNTNMASYCLKPLQGLESEMALYSGFQNYGDPEFNDDHWRTVSAALTGGKKKQGSIDQIVGKAFRAPSNVRDSAYFSVYGQHVNNSGSDNGYLSPVRTIGSGGYTGSSIWNPVEVFKEIFPSGVPVKANPGEPVDLPYSDLEARLGALNAIEQRLEQVKCVGGEQARNKLEALLASYQKLVINTEGSIRAEQVQASQDVKVDIPDNWKNGITNSTRDLSKYWNQHTNFEKLMDIAIDSTVAALALDRTRVSMLQFSASGNDSGSANHDHYKTIKLPYNQTLEPGDTNDHFFGHFSGDPKRRNQARVYQWYYSKLRQLVDKLKAIPDGNGETLFDSTMILATSEFGSYDHYYHDVPHMILGGNQMNFQKGQYIDVHNGAHRDSADLLYGVTNSLGLNLGNFGNSTNAFTV